MTSVNETTGKNYWDWQTVAQYHKEWLLFQLDYIQ